MFGKKKSTRDLVMSRVFRDGGGKHPIKISVSPMMEDVRHGTEEESPPEACAPSRETEAMPEAAGDAGKIFDERKLKKEKKKKSPRVKPVKKQRPSGRHFRELCRNRLFLGSASVCIALLLAFGVMPIMESYAYSAVMVAVLTEDMREGTKIEADAIRLVEMGANNLPKGWLGSEDDAAGKYAAIDMQAGDILTGAKAVEHYEHNDQFLYEIPEGKMAISIGLGDLAESLAGKLRKGDVIQLFAVFDDAENKNTDYYAKSILELQYVEVLSVTNKKLQDIEDDSEGGGDDKTIAAVTLLVNERQAAALAGLSSRAVLHAALISRGDEGASKRLLAEQDRYFGNGEAAQS